MRLNIDVVYICISNCTYNYIIKWWIFWKKKIEEKSDQFFFVAYWNRRDLDGSMLPNTIPRNISWIESVVSMHVNLSARSIKSLLNWLTAATEFRCMESLLGGNVREKCAQSPSIIQFHYSFNKWTNVTTHIEIDRMARQQLLNALPPCRSPVVLLCVSHNEKSNRNSECA